MEKGLNGSGLDPAIRNRVLEAVKTLADALDEPATNHAAKANLREAIDQAMRAVARLKLELHAD
jgi:hypothetical protein